MTLFRHTSNAPMLVINGAGDVHVVQVGTLISRADPTPRLLFSYALRLPTHKISGAGGTGPARRRGAVG